MLLLGQVLLLVVVLGSKNNHIVREIGDPYTEEMY